MFNRSFGQYVRVLVDMNLLHTLSYRVLVERKFFFFYLDLKYENLREFCTHCNMVGHYLEICKRVQVAEEEVANKEL